MRKLGVFLSLLFIFSACAKQDRELTIINQEERIDKYLEALDDDIEVVRENGTSRVVLTPGSGDSASAGDSVYFYYAAYIFSNGKGALFSTNSESVAQEREFPLNEGIVGAVAGGGELVPGLSNGLVGVKSGEMANIIFSAKYGYNNENVYNIPKLSPLFFEVWIERVVKN